MQTFSEKSAKNFWGAGKHTANIVKGKGADTPAHSREIITLNEGRKATPYD